LIERYATKAGKRIRRISRSALTLFQAYDWPGNIRELQNVVEQSLWMANGAEVEVTHLPVSVQAAADQVLPVKERRKQIADELYQAIVSGGYSFWEHIHPLFLQRDITRHDLRELVRRGLGTTRGNYRSMLRLFGMPASDYKRFLNFLRKHQCHMPFQQFRGAAPRPEGGTGTPEPPARPPLVASA
jgi:DNA-binding NtrC family response regulator